MRYVRLFSIYLQDLLEYKSIAVVWFLVNLINPLLYLFFWRGAVLDNQGTTFATISDVHSYYTLYLVLNGFLITHIEHEVAYWDIQEGGLVKYILKPFSYFGFKFLLELTWKLAMGGFALLAAFIISSLFNEPIFISSSTPQFFIAVFSCMLALLLSFVFKMIVGFTAFWVVDFRGIEQLVFVGVLLFSGFIVPLDMFPDYLKNIAAVLPIPYMIYYPIILLQGKLSIVQSWGVISVQIIWLIALVCCYAAVWKHGIKRFSGVGL